MMKYLRCFYYKVLCFFRNHKWNIIHVNEFNLKRTIRNDGVTKRENDGYVLLECRYCDSRAISKNPVMYVDAIIKRNLFLKNSLLTRFVIVEKCNAFTIKLEKLALQRRQSIDIYKSIHKELDSL